MLFHDLALQSDITAAAAVARRLEWPLQKGISPTLVFLATGLLITVGFEVFALRTGRWSYGSDMPTLFGIGALPLAQWILITRSPRPPRDCRHDEERRKPRR